MGVDAVQAAYTHLVQAAGQTRHDFQTLMMGSLLSSELMPEDPVPAGAASFQNGGRAGAYTVDHTAAATAAAI